jgi:hypothetical protein
MNLSFPPELPVWEKLVIPLLVALVSWFLKDYMIGISNSREAATREEWSYRLAEIWSPLYFWSGVVCFEGGKRDLNKFGVKELSEAISKSAYILPTHHYNNLIRLLQQLSGEKTEPITLEEFAITRRYIFGQIEILRYALYGQYEWFNPKWKIDVFASPRQLLRLITEFAIHMVVWIVIASALFGLYVANNEGYAWIVWIAGGGVCVLAFFEVKRRRAIAAEIRRRAGAK